MCYSANLTRLAALAALGLTNLQRAVQYRTWYFFCSTCSQTTMTGVEREEAEMVPYPALASAAGLLRILHTQKTVLSYASCWKGSTSC